MLIFQIANNTEKYNKTINKRHQIQPPRNSCLTLHAVIPDISSACNTNDYPINRNNFITIGAYFTCFLFFIYYPHIASSYLLSIPFYLFFLFPWYSV